MALFPSVPCARLLTLAGSTGAHAFHSHLRARGLELGPKLVVQTERRDPDGSLYGVWRAHVRAWNASAASCAHLLVFEDDAAFDPDDEAVRAGAARAERLLASSAPYDLLLLGWVGHGAGHAPFASPLRGVPCVYAVRRLWRAQHAYVISRRAMLRLRELPPDRMQTPSQGIDGYLAEAMASELAVLVVRPMFVFQSYHESSNPWWPGEGGKAVQQAILRLMASPSFMHAWEEGETSPFMDRQRCNDSFASEAAGRASHGKAAAAAAISAAWRLWRAHAMRGNASRSEPSAWWSNRSWKRLAALAHACSAGNKMWVCAVLHRVWRARGQNRSVTAHLKGKYVE
ncbi:hypothetical protein AB1Y20_002386 [Prymnesium parvum]|uniref:Uncharacterized protein n=1 Tax=Prymnesium parvum TaxID=97485 RepID=A0AB34JA81_PRYPA